MQASSAASKQARLLAKPFVEGRPRDAGALTMSAIVVAAYVFSAQLSIIASMIRCRCDSLADIGWKRRIEYSRH